MKQVFCVAAIAVLLAACNNETKESAGDEASSSNESIIYPYTPETPYRNWQMGSELNTLAAMKVLKAWEEEDFVILGAFLGDSIELTFDDYKAKMPGDSAIDIFKAERDRFKDVKIIMQDWESVISADKSAEYVTLWYKQVWVDNNGVSDSLNVIDDIRMKNGKMIELDEKVQRFPGAKQ